MDNQKKRKGGVLVKGCIFQRVSLQHVAKRKGAAPFSLISLHKNTEQKRDSDKCFASTI